jgi:uncharacterized protein with HEPN domain
VLIHGHDLVDHALVWNAVKRQVPARVAAVDALRAAGARASDD